MKHRFFIIGFTVILIICVLLCVVLQNNRSNGIAEIYSDGKLIREIDLSIIDKAEDIRIDYGDEYNIVHIENKKISVIEASCPDGLCVNQGEIENGAYPIVCLPNKLVIQFKNVEGNNEPDVISR